MNILIEAIVNFRPLSGGISEFTHQIATSLCNFDRNVRVLSRKFDEYAKNDSELLYDIDRYPFVDDRFKIIRLRNSFMNLWSFITKCEPDLLISNFMSFESQLSYLLARSYGIPFILILHGQELNRQFFKCWRNKSLKNWARNYLNHFFVLRGADKLICNSQFTANLSRTWGSSRQQIEIIHPALDTSEFYFSKEFPSSLESDTTKLERKTVLFSLCTLRSRKGIDNVIRALSELKNDLDEYHYIIGGTGSQENELKKMVQEFGLNENVTFTGYIPDSEKSAYFNLSDVFVMPARELRNGSVEGFGIVFLEAGYHGVPVIAGRSGGIPDAVEHEKTGLLVNPKSIQEIGGAVKRLISNKDYRRKLGQNGQKRVQENFTLERLGQDLHEVIKKIRL